MKHIRLIITAIIFTLGLTIVENYHAATFVVTNANDSGAGSLRQAILDANVNAQDDTINFDPVVFATPQTITLTSGNLFISSDGGFQNTKSLTINGTGADKLTINGNNNSRVFKIDFYGKAFINSMKITGGNGMDNGVIPETNSFGGGIDVGGGVLPDGVSQNLTLTNSIVTGNRSIISFSAAGGIGISGKVTIINSAVVNNEVGNNGPGGGITIGNSEVTIINSTISHNTSGYAAAILLNGGYLFLINSTVAFNRATNGGIGGIDTSEHQNTYTWFTARNSIIAKNTGTSNFGNDINGPLKFGGNNIIGNTLGASIFPGMTGNQLDVDPQIDVNPEANGGIIPVHAFSGSSPAIDTGDNCVLTVTSSGGCSTPAVLTDARGTARPQDGDGNGTATVDVGAFEALRAEILNTPTAAPDLRAINDSGVSNTDNITNNTGLQFDLGGVTNGATVELLRNGTFVASAIAAGKSVTLSDNGLTTGVYVYTSRQTIGGVRSLSSPAVTVTVDQVAPVAAVNQAVGQPDPTAIQPFNYSVVFNEAVIGFAANDIAFTDSTANVSSAVINITGTGPSYDVSVSSITSDGVVVLSLPANVVQDIAGNMSVPSTTTDNRVTLDTIPPTVTVNQDSTQIDPTNSNPVKFTVVFSEPVTGFTNADVSLIGSTASVGFATKTVTGSGPTYTVSISGITSNGGFVRATIPAMAAADFAGHQSAASTSTDNQITVDNVSPTVTINQAVGQSDPTNTLPVNFTVVFSETVTGFDSFDISFAGSTINTTGAIVNITGTGPTYNVAVSGTLVSNGGFIRPSVRSSAATDALGNSSSASTATDSMVTIDNVGPTVTINQAVGQSDPTSTQPVNFTVIFNGSVTGFSAADVSLAGSTANVSSATVNITGSGSVYNVSVGNILSNGQVSAAVVAGAVTDAIGNPSSASTSTDNTVTVNLRRSFVDFDGDGKTDISIFRPTLGEWWYLRSSDGGNYAAQFGASTDKLTPGDFTGDGKTDIAFWRPSTGEWFVLRSEDSSYYSYPFGTGGDIPAVGDFDADGKADTAVFRPSNATWFIRRSSDGGATIQQFGANGDVPVVADYDGDSRADIAIYRPSVGEWWINRSTAGAIAFQFGNSSDKPTQGDFTGDGKADAAFWRPATGEWFVLRSEDFSYYSFPFGVSTDIPSPGDYDGDGKFDAAVFRPAGSTWYVQRSTAGTLIQSFGQNGDVPVPSAFVP